jgi:hypothetical protein
MRWLALAIGLPLVACVQVGTDTGSGSGTTGTSSGGTGSSSGSSSSGGDTTGKNCTTDPATQITLCEQVSKCSTVDVDPGAFPNCGFRLHAASAYDIECWCGDYLCPVGSPTSCTEAGQLLDQQASSLQVCQQVDNGACLLPAVDAAGSSTCDKSCESQCAGDPGCIQLCGC